MKTATCNRIAWRRILLAVWLGVTCAICPIGLTTAWSQTPPPPPPKPTAPPTTKPTQDRSIHVNNTTIVIRFQNDRDKQVALLWVDYEGKEVSMGEIAAGESVEVDSSLKSLFRIREGKQTVGQYVASALAVQHYKIKPSVAASPPTPTIRSGSAPAPPRPRLRTTKPPSSTALPTTVPGAAPPPTTRPPLPPPLARTGTPPPRAAMLPPKPPGSAPALPPKPAPQTAKVAYNGWTSTDGTLLSKQADGSWCEFAFDERIHSYREQERTAHTISLIDSDGVRLILCDGIATIGPDEPGEIQVEWLRGTWVTAGAAAQPADKTTTYWKETGKQAQGITVRQLPDGQWMAADPNGEPERMRMHKKTNHYVILSSLTEPVTVRLYNGIATVRGAEDDEFTLFATGHFVSPPK